MHALDLEGQVVQKPALSTLAESPSGLSSETTSSGSEAASVTQALAVAPRLNSLKRSPLGRSVVTALEAELDQVCSQYTLQHGQRDLACGPIFKTPIHAPLYLPMHACEQRQLPVLLSLCALSTVP